jgi:hypothetical protein
MKTRSSTLPNEAHLPAEIRKILLENRYLSTAAQVCAKWHITPYRLRQWKQQWNYAYLVGTLPEMVIVALHQGAHDIAGIIAYLDYLDHARYTPAEIGEVLAQLEQEDFAINHNGAWHYDWRHSANDTSYIF